MTHWMDPNKYNYPCDVFLHFCGQISLLEYMDRTLTFTLNAVPHCTYIICTIPIFYWFFWWNEKHPNFLFGTSTLNPELLLFSFSTATLSIFGKVHWTLNTASNIPYFFLIFWVFYCFCSFSTATVHISIFVSALLDPENSEQAMRTSEHQGQPWGAWQWALLVPSRSGRLVKRQLGCIGLLSQLTICDT